MTEVHFCNLCDQSVPQDHLEDGSAVRHGGRILCATCRDVMQLAATGQRVKSSRAGVMVPLLVGLIGWGAAAYVWLELRDLEGDASLTASAQSAEQTQRLQRVSDGLDRRLEALDARATALDADLLGLRQSTARAAENVQEQLLMLEKAIEPLPDLTDALTRQDQQLRETQTSRTLAEQDLRDLRGAVEALRAGLTELDQRFAAGAAAPAAAGFPAETESLLSQLRDPDPLRRSVAIETLSHDPDPRLAPYVAPLLKDSYEMNRYYAATHLGKLKARDSAAALVEALLDDYSLVRKAANEALVAISGQNLNYDAKGSEGERRKGYERWKQWLDASAPAAPAGSAQ